ncbi:PHP-associated domain-containing protein [Singulisphaera rosea]
MSKFDHHLHTNRHSPDSVIDPLDLVETAREVGLDGVVITEHDYQWHREELEELSAQANGLRVLSGAEISAREGHFLVYGLPNLDETPPGIRVADLVAVVRRHGAAIVAAHPYRWDQPFDAIIAELGPVFDSLELVSNNVTPDTRSKTAQLLGKFPMGATGSSDGHEVGAIGCYYTEFPGNVVTMSDFVAAIRAKQGRPRHRAGAWQTSGPMD